MKDLYQDKSTFWLVIATCAISLFIFQSIASNHNNEQDSSTQVTPPSTSIGQNPASLRNDIEAVQAKLPKDLGNGVIWLSVGFNERGDIEFNYQHKQLAHQELRLAINSSAFFEVDLCLFITDEPSYHNALIRGETVVMNYYGSDGMIAKGFFINKSTCKL